MKKATSSLVIPAFLRSRKQTAGTRKTGCPHMAGMTILFMALFMALLSMPSLAQQSAGSGRPIEITATKTVEWLRNDKQYVARENVVVTQGDMTILSDLLVADYRESAASSTEIWQITATGNVRIKDLKNTAYGDKGVYDVPTGVAVLTGENLRLISPDQTVTARDRMEYHANERMAKAIGNAKVVRAKDTLDADVVTAYFKDETAQNAAPASATPAAAQQKPADGGAIGGGSLDRIVAEGHVVIKTPTETIHGSKAVYRADTNTAEVTGKVRLTRGENVMEGARAEVDLNTNISKMFGTGGEGGRVRGVFFPGADKKDAAKNPPMPAPFTQTAPLPAPESAPNTSGAQSPPAATVAPTE